MAGVSISFRLDMTKPLDMLARLEHFNARAMFDDIGGYLDSEATNRFVTSKDPFGQRWEPSQRAKNTGGKTLLDYGHLRDSVTHQVFIDGRGVEHGSDLEYSAIHQFGGETGHPNGRFTMTARPFIGIGPADETEIDNIVEDHLERALQ